MAKLNSQLISDDPDLWPRVLRLYRDKPGWRYLLHSHVPQSLRETPQLLMPLLRKALADPEVFADALTISSRFPELTPEIVHSLRQPELRAAVGADVVIGSLACLFGVTFHPRDFSAKPSAEQARICARVRCEFVRRFGAELETVCPSERASLESVIQTTNGALDTQSLRASL